MKNYVLLICFMITAGMVSAQALKVAANSNVGIGTGTPVTALEIVKPGYSGFFLKESTGTGAAQFRFRANVGAFVFDDTNGNQKATIEFNGGSQDLNFLNQNNGGINLVSASSPLYWKDGKLGVGTVAASTNLHVVGNAGKTDGTSTWDVLSDKRLKKNVSNYNGGLEEILKIRPVTFQYNGLYGTNSDKIVVGVVAQELNKVAPYMVKETLLTDMSLREENLHFQDNGNDVSYKSIESKAEKSEKFLSINNDAFTYMLINAVKEQQEHIDLLKHEIKELKEIVGSAQAENDLFLNISDSEILLGQNSPNPFTDETTIEYNLPENFNKAFINFYSLTGQLIKSQELTNRNGSIQVSAQNLNNKMYSYNLVVDDKILDSRKMVVAK